MVSSLFSTYSGKEGSGRPGRLGVGAVMGRDRVDPSQKAPGLLGSFSATAVAAAGRGREVPVRR